MKHFPFILALFCFSALAAQLTVNIGTTANDGTGDTLRSAFGKANTNFTELYSASYLLHGATNGAFTNSLKLTAGSGMTFTTNGQNLTLTSSGGSGWSETGNNNLLAGVGAGSVISGTSSNNIFIGYQAGASNTTAYNMMGIGTYALRYNVGGFPMLAIGDYAMQNVVTGSTATVVGYRGFYGTGNAILHNATGSGYRVGYSVQYGDGPTLFGYESAYEVLTNIYNNAFGLQSMRDATNAIYLTAFGDNAFRFGINGSNSIAIGSYSGYYATNTHYNTILGHRAQYLDSGGATVNGNYTNDLVLGALAYATRDNLAVIGNLNVDVAIGTNYTFARKFDVLDTNAANRVVGRFRRGVQGANPNGQTDFSGAPYLQVGGSEFLLGQVQSIGFGYNDDTYTNQPVQIGSSTTSVSGGTKADFVIATRSSTTGNGAPSERLRVLGSGDVAIGRTNALGALDRALTVSAGESGDVRPVLELQGSRTSSGVALAEVDFYNGANQVSSITAYRGTANDEGGFKLYSKATGGSLTPALDVQANQNVNFPSTASVVGGFTNSALTASLPVGTDANKKLVSLTLGNGLALNGTVLMVTNVARLTVTNAFVTAPATLTDAATVATDASLGNTFRVTLGGNRTLGNPTNPTDGQRVMWELKQDATGSRTISLDTKFHFGTDITSITLTTTASKTDYLTCIYNSGRDQWDVVAFIKGF